MPGQIRRRQTKDGKQGNPQAVFQRAHPTKPGARLTTTRTFATVKEARSWLAEMTVRHDSDPLARPDRAKTSFVSLVETWKKVNASEWEPRTRNRYAQIVRTHLMPAFGNDKVSAISRERVEDYLADLAVQVKPDTYPNGKPNPHAGQAYSSGTVHKVHTTLSSIMAVAVKRRMIATNPCHGLKRKAAPRKELTILTQDEVHALADTIATLPYPKQPYAPNRTLILTAAYTGLRASELHALRRRDVDLENGVVHVRRALKGWADDGTPIFGEPKTRESKRTVDLAEEIAELLTAHISPGGSPDDLVFTNSERNCIRQTPWYREQFKPARDLALPEHPELTFHDLRHCFISWLLAAGVDLVTVAAQAGHANPAITAKVYAHVIPKPVSPVRAALSRNVVPVDFQQKQPS
jgi:integrase